MQECRMKLPMEVEKVPDSPTDEEAIKVRKECPVADPQEHDPAVSISSGQVTLSGCNLGGLQTIFYLSH